MRKDISNSILSILLVSALLGCKAKKDLIKPEVASKVVDFNKAKILTAIRNNVSKYSTLSIRAKADLKIDNSDNEVTMNIRINHGKAIWVSVTAIAGLEVARTLITPDSVKIINRLESTYLQKQFDYLYKFSNKQINFNTLEDILAGNPVKETVTENSNLSIQVNQSVLSGMLGSLAYNLVFTGKHQLIQTSLKDDAASQFLVVDYDHLLEVQDQVFPHTVNIRSQADRKNIVINLKYSRLEINETLNMPFSVPKRFTVID